MAGGKRLAEASGPQLETPLVTLQTLLTQSAEKYPDNVALICRHQAADHLYQKSTRSGDEKDCLRWTYSQIHHVATTLAAKLYSLGVRREMRVVAFLRNGAQWLVGFWAAALLGCPFVTINASFADKPDDAQHMLGVAEGSVIMVEDAKMAGDVEKAAGPNLMDSMVVKYVCDTDGADQDPPSGWRSLSCDMDPAQEEIAMPPAEETRTKDDDLVLVIFTSGTTSRPKGVMQTNRSLVSGVQTGVPSLGLDTSSKSCDPLPLFHIFGILYFGHFWASGGSVCIPSAAFEPAATLQAIQDEKLTHLPGPPSLLNALVNHPSCKTTDTTSLKMIAMAAAVVMPEAIKAVGEALSCKNIACPFGMSEGTPITYHPYRNLPIEYSETDGITTGPCTAGARVRICAPDSRDLLQRGELGELHIGGPMIVPGYLGRDSDELYVDDGSQWMITGDQAKMDDKGEVYIMGRYKDLIIRAGENISPSSIEAVLDSMPGITSQVVGVADEVAGEVPAAVLKVDKGAEVDEDAMHELLSEKLGTTFVPAHVVKVQDLGMEDFPRTESGKYQKFELKEPVADFVHSSDTTKPVTEDEESSGKSGDNIDQLHQIWAKLLGMPQDKLSIDDPIQDLADSITVMRAASKIKRELEQDIGPHDIFDHPTIKAQSELLQSRKKPSSGKSKAPADKPRDGSPGVADISHMLGSEEKMAVLQSAFSSIAEPLGLTWDEDVQEVLPVWDWGAIMLRGPRAQSWNHRHAFATTQASTEQLKAALEKALSHQDMLRTLAITSADSTPSHVIIRSSPRWYKHVIREVNAVETAEKLKQLVLNDPELDFACAPGPLFRAVIAPIKDSGTSGLVYQAHHSCFDGLSIPNLVEDLTAYLNSDGKEADITPRSSYKGWADNTYLHRQSAQAQQTCDFHMQRLKGLSKLEDSLWPKRRVSGWFKGNFADVAKDHPDRKALDGDDSIGVDGVKSQVSLHGVQKLKQEHGFSAPAILKTSLALLNAHYTSTKNAIFTNYEAGRDWAFQEQWIADLLPNAMDVNGPTLEAVLNNITIDKSETCLAMIQRVQTEQSLLTRNAHAPLSSLQQQLGDDGTNLLDTMQRQIFNWLPGLKSTMSEPDDSPLKRTQMQSRSDVGILWNCGMIEDTFHVTASYDDAQLRKTEVEEAVERWCRISEWVSKEENWERAVGDCPDL
ncbi:Putative AMP-dependent synthetase/ligase, Condensation domain, phosphopantetheine binding ACP [Septoria linicola]|uniref:AMP-dependent synthetase/ligase, Condensation domain, phosphopantetheine binding ACP n=1 Tax=Septoria linicola TaxID=215465 RepID=A0A9Q9APA5_9PEZI|nr:Putative AMP-dependent synthetase/ligase, Condensation domain, phosphopantetheine binding ACP [Septoria linicola]